MRVPLDRPGHSGPHLEEPGPDHTRSRRTAGSGPRTGPETGGGHRPLGRVVATPAALGAIDALTRSRGPLVFVQSAGCCEGSAPMCFDTGELVLGAHDVLLGHVAGCPLYIDVRQARLWEGRVLLLDVAPGEPEGFSLAASEGLHFVAVEEAPDLTGRPAM